MTTDGPASMGATKIIVSLLVADVETAVRALNAEFFGQEGVEARRIFAYPGGRVGQVPGGTRGEAIMPNRRPHDHIGQFNFKVEINKVTVGAFKNVEGLDSETEVVEYQDGEDIVLSKRPGGTKHSGVILRRGYINSDELWNWRRLVRQGKSSRLDAVIYKTTPAGATIACYRLFGAWPSKVETGPRGDSEIESAEIVVENIRRVPPGS